MKLKLILLTIITVIPMHNAANASVACDTYTPCPPPNSGGTAVIVHPVNSTCGYATTTGSGTTSTPYKCYAVSSTNVMQFDNCTQCPSGRILKSLPLTYFDTDNSCNNLSGNINACCLASASSCSDSNCLSDTSYSSNEAWGTGVEIRVMRECDACEGCVENTLSRCVAGYYGNGIICEQCPKYTTSDPDINTTSVAGNNAEITGCFVPKGSRFSDTSGTGTFTQPCYYTK